MVNIVSERRMVENEAYFRQYNEQVQKKLDGLQKMAESDGHHLEIADRELLLHFYCECADENCRKRIVMSLDEYREIHKKRDRFVLIPGHEVEAIEHIIAKQEGYVVVEKLLNPPEVPTKLHQTEVSNT